MKNRDSILLVAILWSAIATIASGDTFTVTNTDDTGPGSLRQAITDANGHTGLDMISFNIPGEVLHTITPASQLPFITSPVTLDGYTQLGSHANTLANGDNAVLLIEINAAIVSNNGNGFVLQTGATGSTIRGVVIDNGWSTAVMVQTDTISIEGCFLGTDATGTVAHPNSQGVNADFGLATSGMRVGGVTPAARNVISGNGIGVVIQSGANQMVQGNFIGTNAAGTAALANTAGVDIRSSDNLIGGNTAAARNVIGANSTGITINASTGNRIQGNFIGTDVTGTHALGLGDGISSTGAAQIGGLTTSPGTPPGNVISGTLASGGSGHGILVGNGISGNVIQGNLIGTDATGTQPLSNGLDGVEILGPSNVIGGTDVMARNVISSNGRHGIFIGTNNASVHDTLVQGNFIGTDITGTALLGNAGDGISVVESTNNTVGGPVTVAGAPPGNLIAGNAGRGIGIFFNAFGVTGFAIKGNSIFSNGGLGIDLSGDGVTLNDPGDPDTGVNNLQNYPLISEVTISSGSATIDGSLNSTANTTFRLEFFSSTKTDQNGFGEGETFLGFTDVTTNASGNATYSVSFPVSASARTFTATATDPGGNTSEFSPAFLTRLLNISTRMKVLTSERVLIGGFIITGTGPKKVIIRGIGPSLGALGVPGALADTTLELHGSVSINNDNWRSDQEAEIIATGFQPGNDLEAAIVANLDPGSYTAILAGKNETTGVGLVEVYDLDRSAGSKLANISTRGFVDTGDDVMIGGLIAGPDIGATTVLIRAIGPSLSAVGIQDALLDPTLELHDGSGAIIAMNDNWKDTQQVEIEATGIAPTDDHESAILQTLVPGNYTAIVRGKDNTTGVGLVEAYNLQ